MSRTTTAESVHRAFPCEHDDIYVQLQDEIRRRATTGGLEHLQQLFDQREVQLSERVPRLSWAELQGRFLGIFGAFFYYWDEHVKQVRLMNLKDANRPWLNPPSVDVSQVDGKWFRDDIRHNRALKILKKQREEGKHAEFYRVFAVKNVREQRLSPMERDCNVLLCPEGEVCFFIFEYLVRRRFEEFFHVTPLNEIRNVPRVDAMTWLEREITEAGKLFCELEEIGLMHVTGEPTLRTPLIFEWIQLQVDAEASGADKRFLDPGKQPWFSTWINFADAQRIIEVSREAGARPAFLELGKRLLEVRTRRSQIDVQRMARFLIPAHMDYRYKDSGIPKAVFACPLGPTSRQDAGSESVAFAVGAIDLLHKPQSQFFKTSFLNDDNRRRLFIALPTLALMATPVERQLRDDSARSLAAAEARRMYVTESLQTFSIISHEINSLFVKHFPVVRKELGIRADAGDQLAAEAEHAWDIVAATAEIGYLFAKAVSADENSDKRKTFHKRFLEPLATLWMSGTLDACLYEVAKRVCERERQPGSGKVDLQGCSSNGLSPKTLAADQFARCYMLVAEPVRNLLHHGRGANGTWHAHSDESGFEVELVHPRAGTHLPPSKTFMTLCKFLEELPGCQATLDGTQDSDGHKLVRWYMRVGGESWQSVITSLNPDASNAKPDMTE